VSPPYHDGSAVCDSCSSTGGLFSCADTCHDNGPRLWADGEFLLWKIRDSSLPRLTSIVPVGLLTVDTSDRFLSPTGANLGFLNGHTIGFVPVMILTDPKVAGGSTVDEGEHTGGRFSLGFYLDSDQLVGLEGGGFWLGRRTFDFVATTGNSVNQFLINTPFTQNTFVVTPGMMGAPDTRTLAKTTNLFFVRESSATLLGSATTEMWGAEANLVSGRCFFGCISYGGFIGFRYVDFHEDLAVEDDVSLFRPTSPPALAALDTDPLGGSLPETVNFTTFDLIRTRNHFYGGQVGVDMDAEVGHFFLKARGKVALGAMHEVVDIESRAINTDGTLVSGGLFGAPTDNGEHHRNRVCVVPEINVKLGYAVTHNLRAFVGYDFLYISDVVRPGDQVSLSTTNTTITVGGQTTNINVNQPTFRFRDTDMWINGINFGIELVY
jgi:hypothetical protein